MKNAPWASVGGHIRSGREPKIWQKNASGAWERKELIVFW
jgi:hypothetical protein